MAKQVAGLPDEQDQYWQEYVKEQQAKEGERVEDAAKFLSGMISISLAIFVKINPQAFNLMADTWWAAVVVVLWLLSLGLSFFVFFPFGYRYHPEVPSSIQAFHEKMVRRKRGLLLWSMVCFFLALCMLGIAFVAAVS